MIGSGGSGTGAGGNVELVSGSGSTAGGEIRLSSGSSAASSGAIRIESGDAPDGIAGDVSFVAGGSGVGLA